MYMIGQFANGFLNDRFGPRLIVGVGLLVAVVSNLLMGLASALVMFGVLNILNGVGQSTGWSGTVKNMSSWFRHEERGVVMAWWGTCYALGGFIATAFATYMATQFPWYQDLGWRRGFFAPAILLGAIALAYVLFARNKPSDVGLEDVPENPADPDLQKAIANGDAEAPSVWKIVLTSSAVWTTGLMYFFLKCMRYTFLFWLPLYFVQSLGYSEERAGYTSSLYELAGFLGVIVAGYASDKLMQSRRFPVGSIMLFMLAGACLVYPQLARLGQVLNILGISLVGILTFGPDALMSGAAAMDMGSQKGAGMASGFINGLGSAGQLCSPLLVAYMTDWWGWDSLFLMFTAFAIIGGVLLATKWNYGGNSRAPKTA
jgi:OPA family glycerol-3-phosphate transporter-like MFS transporter